MQNGLFISFEGVGCSGKSTQLQMLADCLTSHQYQVVTTSDFRGTLHALKCRERMMNEKKRGILSPLQLQMIAMESRADVTKNVIIPALNENKIVLCDRYIDSGLACQGYGENNQAVLNAYPDLCKKFLNNFTPSLTFLLNISVSSVLERLSVRGDRDCFENKKWIELAAKGFLTIAKNNPQRIKVIDGHQKKEYIHNQIVSILQKEKGLMR